MVTVIGSVTSRSDNSPESAEPRHFTLESSVYDASKTAPTQFSVDCFFENTKRWLNVKTPTAGTFLSITAKVAGRSATTNHLALRLLDMTYLPRPASAGDVPTPATTPASKRSGRWEGRAAPSTPSKKPRLSVPEVPNLTRTPPAPACAEQAPSGPASPSTVTLEGASLSSLDADSRPHRNRHPPKKYVDVE
jgi:hypothetical protein